VAQEVVRHRVGCALIRFKNFNLEGSEMLLAFSVFGNGLMWFVLIAGWFVIFRAAGKFAINNPEKTATAFKIARTFLKK
jgi:hypothetical protein